MTRELHMQALGLGAPAGLGDTTTPPQAPPAPGFFRQHPVIGGLVITAAGAAAGAYVSIEESLSGDPTKHAMAGGLIGAVAAIVVYGFAPPVAAQGSTT